MRAYLNSQRYDGKKETAAKQCLLPCLMMLIGGMPGKSYAVASPDDTLKPYVASGMVYDNNFFRLSDQADPMLIIGKNDKSEFIKQLTAGFDMDWTISRQHILIKASANQNWFQNFSSLDYTGWNTEAEWNWHLGSNLDGEIGYANIETLGSFSQLNGLINNLQNNQNSFANAAYLFHPNGKVKFGLFRTENQFDDESRQFSNNTEDNAQLDLQYLSPIGNTLGVRVLATDGQYPQREITSDSTQDNAYTRMNYALTWDWQAGSRTRINGLLGYTQQHHAHFGARDFADIVAELNLSWRAGEKTLLDLSARREIYQAGNQFTSFLLTQGLWFNFTWQPSPKITLKLPMSYQQQQYLGNVGAHTVGFTQQKDNIGNVGLNLTYKPLENISIGLVLNYEKRDSNTPLSSYETQSAGINLQLSF